MNRRLRRALAAAGGALLPHLKTAGALSRVDWDTALAQALAAALDGLPVAPAWPPKPDTARHTTPPGDPPSP